MLSGNERCSVFMGSYSVTPWHVSNLSPRPWVILVLPPSVLSLCPAPPLVWAGCPQQVWATCTLKLSGREGVREGSGFMFPLLIDLRLPVLIALVVKGGYSSLFVAASL